MFKRCIALLFFIFSLQATFENHQTFSQWHDACNDALEYSIRDSVVSADHFKSAVKKFLRIMQRQIADSAAWHNTDRIHKALPDNFVPYVQRLHAPQNTVVAFHGDIHGNVHALNSYLELLASKGYLDKDNPFHIIKDNFYLIFLGDYVDRGYFGVETIYTILRLKIENPDQVFMVRGNHEDLSINKKYGFTTELLKKFGNKVHASFLELIQKVYNSLPVALYLGLGNAAVHDYILCCHGGWELGYDPLKFLQAKSTVKYHAFDTLERNTMLAHLSEQVRQKICSVLPVHEHATDTIMSTPTTPVSLGFLWHDFIPDSGETIIEYQRARGWRLGKPLIDELRERLDRNDIHLRAIFRAHQHGDTSMFSIMRKDGVAKLWQGGQQSFNALRNGLWDGVVCTFLVAPYTGYNNSFDAWGELKVGKDFASSRLTIYKNYSDVGA